MLKVDGLNGSATWQPHRMTKKENAREEFSKILNNLKESRPADYDEQSSKGEDVTTITRVMSDGSVLITVMRGNEIVSQSKTRAAHAEENPDIVSTGSVREPCAPEDMTGDSMEMDVVFRGVME